MKNQMGSSRMDTVLKLLLVTFVSLLAFSSGVFFGKQLSDSDYQLKALEGDFHESGKLAEHKNLDVNPEDAIAEEEVAALSEKYVESEREESRSVASTEEAASHEEHGGQQNNHPGTASNAHEENAHEPAQMSGGTHDAAMPAKKTQETNHGHDSHAAMDAHESHSAKSAKPDLSAVHKAAERVANNTVPVENHKPAPTSRVPNSLPRVVGASADVEFTVQVASYPTAEAAKSHADELVKKGFPAFPVEAAVNGKTWYRVSVGSFKSMKEATSFRAQLLKQTDVPSAIVQRIQR